MSEPDARSSRPAATQLEKVRARRADIMRLARYNGVHSVRVFGSVARGEALADSDIDLLVEFEEGRSLLDLGAFLMDVQDLLGTKVDVVTPAALSPRVRGRVEGDAVPL